MKYLITIHRLDETIIHVNHFHVETEYEDCLIKNLKTGAHHLDGYGKNKTEDMTPKMTYLNKNQRVIDLPEPIEGHRWSDETAFPEIDQRYFAGFSTANAGHNKYFVQIPIKPEVRVYDWSKTGPDVLFRVYYSTAFVRFKNLSEDDYTVCQLPDDVWQSHSGGECPIDEDSCVIVTRSCGGFSMSQKIPTEAKINWENITSWKFERLADNVVWNLSAEERN